MNERYYNETFLVIRCHVTYLRTWISVFHDSFPPLAERLMLLIYLTHLLLHLTFDKWRQLKQLVLEYDANVNDHCRSYK